MRNICEVCLKEMKSSEDSMNSFIIEYASLDSNNQFALQDLKLMMVKSKSSDKAEVESQVRDKFDKANSDLPQYNGVWISVKTIAEHLDLPCDVLD